MKLRSTAFVACLALAALPTGCSRRPATSPMVHIVPNLSARPSSVTADAPPSVQFVVPRPSNLLSPIVPPIANLRWAGSDPDGPRGLPRSYKLKVLRMSADESLILTFLANPDSARRLYAPDFAGWQDIPGDSTVLRGLEPNDRYLVIVEAFDRQGAFDPVFSLQTNMLFMRVAFSQSSFAPLLTVTAPPFTVTATQPSLIFASAVDAPLTAGVAQPVSWSAVTQGLLASPVDGFRWSLDLADTLDDSARRNPRDLAHWSAWGSDITSATIGPFSSGETHDLYVEVRDRVGFMSLEHVRFHVAAAPPASARARS
ncbi:MAG TPA: hypothetical protein VFK69_13385 [Candidatus Eisenbacteria bacterium]|nr:hypothetical protein [Candidatus Eisenbacteria bacterium]